MRLISNPTVLWPFSGDSLSQGFGWKKHLPVGLTEHTFHDTFLKNMIFKVHGTVNIELHDNISNWYCGMCPILI